MRKLLLTIIKLADKRTFLTILTALSFTSCLDDEPKDITNEITISVSSETDIMYDLFDSEQQYPMECMRIMTEDNPGVWERLAFGGIEGFTYERGHEYELRVRRTILANPPMDATDRTYSLVRILDDRLVVEPEVPVDKEIKTEEDIEYYDLCPIDKYAIASEFLVDTDGNIHYADGSPLPSYKRARIWMENILDKADPNWRKFQSVPYMAIYSFVLSPLTDKIRLIRNESNGPMFKEVIPDNEFRHITQSLRLNDELHYTLILANVHKQGLQKLQFTVRKHKI